jgi:hypothetical protein
VGSEIVAWVGFVCVLVAGIGWLSDLARGRTTLRASLRDEHGPKPVWAALLALALLAMLGYVVTLALG